MDTSASSVSTRVGFSSLGIPCFCVRCGIDTGDYCVTIDVCFGDGDEVAEADTC